MNWKLYYEFISSLAALMLVTSTPMLFWYYVRFLIIDSDPATEAKFKSLFLLNVPGLLLLIIRSTFFEESESEVSTPDIESGLSPPNQEAEEEEEEDFVSMDIDVVVDITQPQQQSDEEEDFASMDIDVVVDIIQAQELSDQETRRRIQEMARRCTECAICMEEFESDQDDGVVLKHCGHRFHELCIGVWSETGGKCPICLGSIDGIFCYINDPTS